MKTGTDSIGAIWDSPLKKCAAKMTKLPVMWAVNSPLRPRKLMMSVHPAVTLSTTSSACTSRDSTEAADVFGRGVSADMVPAMLLESTSYAYP
jgi:hypothetical protein